MFSVLLLALTVLRLQLASAQSTLVATHTTFSDGSVGDPSTSGVVALKGTPITELPAAVATFTSCYVVSTQATTTATATVSFDPTDSLPPGAQCYEYISEGNNASEEIPLLQVGSDGFTTPYKYSTASYFESISPTSLSSSNENVQSGSSSSSKKTVTIIGAVLGGVLGCLLIGGILLWFFNSRRRQSKLEISRAANWMKNRRAGGWSEESKIPQNFEMQTHQLPNFPLPTTHA